MTTLLLHLSDVDEARWADRYRAALPEMRVVRRGDAVDPASVDYIFVWKPRPDAFSGLTRLKAVLSLGAGVDALLKHPALPAAPMVRFIDEDLTQRMSDYVIAQVTMHQRLLTRFRRDQAARRWQQLYPPAAGETRVGIMGLGVLGADAARKLRSLGFAVNGWSRSPHQIEGVTSFAADDLDGFLAATDILVCLLPLTPQTTGILNYELFRKLGRQLDGGPVIVNAARGGHQNEADVVRALGDGTLGAASLDVFESEPLRADSPLWGLDNCYLTPHIAAISNIEAGVRYFSRIIRAHEAGEPLPNVVDRGRGY
ncbi:MAG TPA: glyoxylate/hydroxypyruvate reductase A [Devosia sp.]|nr:glyoxylate/hydroxypyruvate reductase A [Devosia sp.]